MPSDTRPPASNRSTSASTRAAMFPQTLALPDGESQEGGRRNRERLIALLESNGNGDLDLLIDD